MPLGVIVIDVDGTIRIANARVLRMAGCDHADDMVGRSLFEFLDAQDHAAIIESIPRGDDFPNEILGPFKMVLVDGAGNRVRSEQWAHQVPPGLGFDGYIITITPESARDRLADAVRTVASGAELSETLPVIADAMTTYPIEGSGTLLLTDGRRITAVAGPWPLGDIRRFTDCDPPWLDVARGGVDRDVTVDQLPPAIRATARAAGFESVWLRGVDAGNARRAVLVTWLRRRTPPTVNQAAVLAETTSLAALAFNQADHRASLKRAARQDYLTGLGNRAALDQMFAKVPAETLGVLYIDLDDFKGLNDRFGHAVGDEVLCAVGDRITRAARPEHEVFRLGGDEFVVVCGTSGDRTDHGEVESTARRIVSALQRPLTIDGTTVSLSASVGTTTGHTGELGLDLLRRADLALLDAKREGKAQWRPAVAIPTS